MQDLDQARMEQFSQQMIAYMNGAALSLMTSVGHQTGIFDVMAQLPPSTSQQIADAAGLNERYVREWLGAMVTGRIVVYSPADCTFALPAEHAAWLTRSAGPRNMAAVTQHVTLMASVEQPVIECFRNGGGVPHSAYPAFQRQMFEMSAPAYDATLVPVVLPMVSGLVERLESGIEVADIGCGSGHAINVMARAFPKSRFTGYDISEEGTAAGRAEAEATGNKNASFVIQDIAELCLPAHFDLITAFDVIHDQVHPDRVLKNVHESLRADGDFLMVDIAASSHLQENLDIPMAPFMYAASTMRCMTTSLAYNGAGLGTMWGTQKAVEMLSEAGLTQIEVKQAPGNTMQNYYVCRK